MSHLVVAGALVSAPENVHVSNFLEHGTSRFAGKSRSRATELVLHETVTRDAPTTIRILRKRGLSVHLIVDHDGTVFQHGDLTEVMQHAGRHHNRASVGIEVVNPYYPRNLRATSPWQRFIAAPWAHEGFYVLPTLAQAEATAQLANWFTSASHPALNIPRRWPGLRDGLLAMSRLKVSRAGAGVYAHQYFGHADGAWLALYTWLRLEAGLLPIAAYEQAVRRATRVRQAANVQDLLPTARSASSAQLR